VGRHQGAVEDPLDLGYQRVVVAVVAVVPRPSPQFQSCLPKNLVTQQASTQPSLWMHSDANIRMADGRRHFENTTMDQEPRAAEATADF